MSATKGRRPLFERLKAALEEGIRHAEGEIALKTTTLERPDPPPESDPTGGHVVASSRGPFRPGEAAPRSGQYLEVGPRGGRGRAVTVAEGEPLPPTTRPNRTYTLVDPPRNTSGRERRASV